jgi:hypothetical protein
VVPVVGGGHALVLEYAPGGNLGALVAARGALDPAEVTTILVPLGQALERLHGRGLVHSDLSPGNVLFAHDGRPLLSDLGVSRLLGAAGPGPHGTPGFVDPAVVHGVDPRASDVWALAALGWFALTGRPPGEPVDPAARTAADVAAPALTRLLAEVLGADPPGRPSPGELAHRAWTAVPPAPIRLLTGRDPEAAASASRTTRQAVPSPARDEAGVAKDRDLPRAVRRRRDVRNDRASDSARARPQRVRPAASGVPRDRRRLRSGGTVAVLVVGVLAALGVTWWAADLRGIGSDPPADHVRVTAEQAAAPRDVPDVERVLADIGRARAKAFSTASAAPLVGADEPGSAAMTADQAVVGGLADRGWRLAGVTFAISDVRVVHRDVRTATVTARVTTSAHRRVTADGAVVQTVAAEKPRRVTLSLVSVPGAGWRVRAVS